MTELFIANRYLRSKHKINFITIISILSTIGITIGVAALIVVLSVFNGFGNIVTDIMINFDPHIRIDYIGNVSEEEHNYAENILKSQNNIVSFHPYVQSKAILINRNSYEILNLKGIEANTDFENWGVHKTIKTGYFKPDSNSLIPQIILGTPMALRLSVMPGDTIIITSFPDIEKSLLNYSLPVTKKYLLSGIFQTNNKNYDYNYVFTDLLSAKQTLSFGNRISGIEIRLEDIDDSQKLKDLLNDKLDPAKFSIKTWFDLHKDLYTVMLIERWSAYIILCLIIAVATFNILGSLTMSVIEKKKDIGVLRSMGMPSKSILRIFMFEGILVGTVGTIAGLIIGLFICYLQIEYKFYPLDPSKYILDAIPIQIRLSDIFAITGMSMFLSVIASLYPAARAVKISIIDAIKWE